ncbi:MAG: transposase, partial [Bacteroidota bacterium]
MADQRRVFTREFKREAVRLSNESGKGVTQVAEELGVPRNTLTRWRAEAIADPQEAFRGNGKRTIEQERIRQLERDVARLEQEKAVLKNYSEAVRSCEKRNSNT